MTSFSESATEEDTAKYKIAKQIFRRHHCRNVLKCRENFKSKCSKCYKRKLKKRRRRALEPEDEEILKVSNVLITSLNIKSPNKQKTGLEIEVENLRPTNYLFKMVKTKQNGNLQNYFKSKDKDVSEDKFVEIDSSQESPTSQEKKQTNAFKLLMDSRNKSLGSNSPGKEKLENESEVQETLEKKSVKAKRLLVLQKMAESKGSLKKKEMEEYQDKIIKKKMEKRAEKLKSMILHKEPRNHKADKQKKVISKDNPRSPLNNLNIKVSEKPIETPVKTLQLVSLFTETGENNFSPEKKLMLKEDVEFLNKLSPSLKKKESMLSYFKKVEKDSDIIEEADNDHSIIKVKFKSKSKKKVKKAKLRLNKDNVSNDKEETVSTLETIIEDIIVKPLPGENGKEGRKRKRKIEDSTIIDYNNLDKSLTVTDANDNGLRPKRNTKKPVKYSEESYISSSDEELHIFTPKKKKQSDSKQASKNSEVIDLNLEESNKKVKSNSKPAQQNGNIKKFTKKVKPILKEEKKNVKLAPIFTMRSPLDSAAIEAKQKFLNSGVPDQLKKIISKQRDTNVFPNSFVKVLHIQQLNSLATLANIQYDIPEEPDDTNADYTYATVSYQKLLNHTDHNSTNQIASICKSSNDVQLYLHHLKNSNKKFPVYRTYKLMRSKKKGEFKNNINYLDLDNSVEILNGSIDGQVENPDQLNWCDKYKPLDANQIIGNFDSVRELKKWLVTWTENKMKTKSNLNDSDSSDFCMSDADSRDSAKNNNNLLILSGPVGSGKTSCVYAIAAELSIKVIEVNASSKRTGKIMLQDLQEATQSHKVNRGTGSNENSQKSQEIVVSVSKEIKVKKRGRPKKFDGSTLPQKKIEKPDKSNLTSSQENTRTVMSLILIDDADIVFDQDDGFCSAIVQLVNSSKRPVILITASLACPHLQRFMQGSKILKMNPLIPSMLGTWLDIMCLVDTGVCNPGVGAKTLDFFKGDIRKTINYLQFYFCSQAQSLNSDKESSQKIDERINNDEESSNISWAEHENFEEKNVNNNLLELQMDNNYFNTSILKLNRPLDLLNTWWSVPKLLSVPESSKERPNDEVKAEDNETKDKELLESLTSVLDAISVCDFISLTPGQLENDVMSQSWFSYENDSVSESHNYDKYDINHEVNNEICCEYLKGSVAVAQRKLQSCPKLDLDMPGTSVQRKKDRLSSRHSNLTNSLIPQVVFDRRALALDYWSSCRTICRIEQTKTDSNNKRNNRFCHYLKSLSIHCKNDAYDSLADSLRSTTSSTDPL